MIDFNIFWYDYLLEENVKQYPDAHCNKMLIEYAQMLSTANRLTGLDEGYRITHINHPCNIWVRRSIQNWRFLRALSFYLHEEWMYRHENYWGHASYRVISNLTEPELPNVGITERPLCMPDYCKIGNVVESYREYFRREKRHLASWKKRQIPKWFY